MTTTDAKEAKKWQPPKLAVKVFVSLTAEAGMNASWGCRGSAQRHG
jgi:hypothetical protein